MNKIIYALALLSFFFTVSFSYADSNTHADARAQKAIDACWAISQEDRDSGVTKRMNDGTANSALCLENEVIEIAQNYLFTEIPDHVTKLKEDLKSIRSSYADIYWNLYNEIDPCTGRFFGCGSAFSSMHSYMYAKLLEGLIKDQYRQIEDHQID